MKFSLLISDLHLSASSRKKNRLFQHFIEQIAPDAEALYILGDLFESWAGDDDLNTPFNKKITGALRALSVHGTKIYIMRGNRDFLMGGKLAEACNATLLADPVVLEMYGKQTLLSHGDALCTDDTDYQDFRQFVRNSSWQLQFLSLPLAQRKAQIEQVREKSKAEKQLKAMDMMNVNLHSVNELLEKNNYPRMIHGHTHRPAHHRHHLDGHTCDRWVLGDWDSNANALRCDVSGVTWQMVEL
ncbi:MAG: UDP-2,3-diacylglucosamine diphosphatase [Gallionellaceae bacterium]|jgi:UDP-2,3-diacylglucosamine hydrolase